MSTSTRIDPIGAWVSRELEGHPVALRFLDIVYRAIEVWDDIYDRDGRVSDDDVHRAFTALLLELPTNQFFEQHKAALIPALAVMINSWHVSNALSREGAQGAHGYTLRKEFINLCLMVVMFIHGIDRARVVAIEAWTATAEADSFEEYQKGI